VWLRRLEKHGDVYLKQRKTIWMWMTWDPVAVVRFLYHRSMKPIIYVALFFYFLQDKHRSWVLHRYRQKILVVHMVSPGQLSTKHPVFLIYLKKAAARQPMVDSVLSIENDFGNHGRSSLKDSFRRNLSCSFRRSPLPRRTASLSRTSHTT
jgi:hypothetical protein